MERLVLQDKKESSYRTEIVIRKKKWFYKDERVILLDRRTNLKRWGKGSPHNEHQTSGPRPVKLCLEQ